MFERRASPSWLLEITLTRSSSSSSLSLLSSMSPRAIVSLASSMMNEHSSSVKTGDRLSKSMLPFFGKELASIPALLAPTSRPMKSSSLQEIFGGLSASASSPSSGCFPTKASLPPATSAAWSSIMARFTSRSRGSTSSLSSMAIRGSAAEEEATGVVATESASVVRPASSDRKNASRIATAFAVADAEALVLRTILSFSNLRSLLFLLLFLSNFCAFAPSRPMLLTRVPVLCSISRFYQQTLSFG
mmetsp:Transcript_23214/g.54902  ORF Transcript_23214/g.54902 Transcript_23214/m.54902 type:complete len:246 (+) Transcript_23214:134-871(+)